MADEIADLAAFDEKIAAIDDEIGELVDATPTSLRDVYGVGPIVTGLVLGEVSDVARFRSRHHFASYNGTAPADRGSAGNPQPSVNTKGDRKLNQAIHVIAITQMRGYTPGRACYLRKLQEGKTKNEAVRALKRRISDAVYRQLIADAEKQAGPGGQTGTTLQSSVTGPTPTAGSSERPQPGPDREATPTVAATA